MSDITKCDGAGCPLRESCYRFTAEANSYRQSYFMEVPLKWLDFSQIGVSDDTVVANCEEYWEYPKKTNAK